MDLERLGAPAWRKVHGQPTPSTPGTRHRRRCAITTSRTGPSSAPRSLPAGAQEDPAGRASRHVTWPRCRCGTCGRARSPWSWSAGCRERQVRAGRQLGRPTRVHAVLNSDRIRKELAGLPAETSARAPYGSGIYTAEWTGRTYRELQRRAAVLLAHGESVIADASFIGSTAAGRCGDNRRRGQRRPGAAALHRPGRAGGPADERPPVASRTRTRRSPRRWRPAADPWPDAAVIDTEVGGTAGVAGESVDRALEAIRTGRSRR